MNTFNSSTNNAFYHVLVETEDLLNKKNKEYIELDFKDKHKIINKIFNPFKTGVGQVEISGYYIDPKTVRRILVHQSQTDSSIIKESIKSYLTNESNKSSQEGIYIPVPTITEKVIFNAKEKMQNITDEITAEAELLQNEKDSSPTNIDQITSSKKYFISHSVKDEKYAENVVELLNAMGVKDDEIFCCSADGMGIKLGEDWKERLKKELQSDTHVIFLISENFNNSPICLCEMGASWILSKNHTLVLIPPANYNDLQGIIATQGFKINETRKWTELKDSLSFQPNNTIWEKKRDKIITEINQRLELTTQNK